jgi:hypothetical protein
MSDTSTTLVPSIPTVIVTSITNNTTSVVTNTNSSPRAAASAEEYHRHAHSDESIPDDVKVIEYSNIDNLSQDLEQLVNNQKLADILFLVGPQKIKVYAHKVFLVQRSIYFHTMFLSASEFMEAKAPRVQLSEGIDKLEVSIIEIPNFELSVFLKVIRYLYCGKVKFEQSYDTDAMYILGAADFFQCEELKNYCIQHLQGLISGECVLDLLYLANSFSCDALVDTCFDYINCNTQVVLDSEAFCQLDSHTLYKLLESEYLAVDEIHIFTALLKHTIMQMYEEIQESECNKDEKERQEDEEFIKKLFTRVEKTTQRKRSSLSRMARRSSLEQDSVSQISSLRKRRDSINLPDVYIKKFNGGYEAFISNLGRALQSRYKERFKEIIKEHIHLIRFPLMTAEQLTNVVEPLDIVPDQLMLEAYRFLCVANIQAKNKKSNNTGASTPTPAIPSKTLLSFRCQKRTVTEPRIEFDDSKILTEMHKRILNQWCEVGPNNRDKKKKRWTLAYSATRDGFSAAQFHKLCDNKGPSVTIARTTDGYIFGGYNSTSWSSTTCWKPATDTFLFSLVNPYNDGPRKLKVKNNQRAVYNHPSFGPTFGGGGKSYFDPYDIYIDSSMSHGHTNVGNSYSTFRGGWRSDEAQKSLAGSLNAWTLNECEVFLLQ